MPNIKQLLQGITPHTPAQDHLAEVEKAMYGTTYPAEPAAAQKAKALLH